MNARESLQAFAEYFFTQVCPRVLSDRAPELRALGGTFGFRIRGLSAQEWVIDFGGARVRRASSAGAQLRIDLDASDFHRLVDGRLDVEEAIAAGRFEVQGQRALLPNIGLAFSPA